MRSTATARRCRRRSAGRCRSETNCFTTVEGVPYLLKARSDSHRGSHIGRTGPGFDNQTGEPAVAHKSGRPRRNDFPARSRARVSAKRMAMVLWEKGKGEVVTAPVIRSEIPGGRVQISGG